MSIKRVRMKFQKNVLNGLSLLMIIGGLFLSYHLPAMTCSPCLASVGETAWTLADRLLATQQIGKQFGQVDVPITITSAGIYSLCEDLLSTSSQPVITITGDDVLLNLACHAVTVTQQAEAAHIGISVLADRVAIGNGRMVAQEGDLGLQPVTLIALNGVHDITIDDVYFAGTSGITSDFNIGSKAVDIDATSFSIVVYNCAFQNVAYGTFLSTATQVIISNCNFSSTIAAAVRTAASRMLVEECHFFGRSTIQVVEGRDITLSHCSIAHSNTTIAAIDIQAAGTPGSIPTDIVVRDCIVNGTVATSQQGISVSSGAIGIVVEHCLVSDTAGDGMNITGTNVVVRGCTVNTAGGDGISVAGTSFNVFVQNCEVANSGGSNYVGVNPFLITTGLAATATSSYWMDVSLP